MISYTDGSWAEMWSKTHETPTEPLWLDTIYWSTGAHYPGPNYIPYKNHCGKVMTAEYNAWIEGALLSVERAITSF